jgi:hypothetical protein
MKSIQSLGLALSAAALLGAAATAQASLSAVSLNFDGAGSTASAFTPAGLTIGYGQFVPDLDGFGDPIPGSDHWELDLGAGAVPVINPFTVGWGVAPSPSQALDVRGGPVLMVFDTPFDMGHFSATLDNSTLGDLFGTEVNFYDEFDVLLASIGVNQSTPGFIISADNVGLVKTILLPSTAFYDNITAVPEPGTALVGAALGLVAVFRRRRGHASA